MTSNDRAIPDGHPRGWDHDAVPDGWGHNPIEGGDSVSAGGWEGDVPHDDMLADGADGGDDVMVTAGVPLSMRRTRRREPPWLPT